MRYIFTVFIFLFAFGCSEKIPFERQIKEMSIRTAGIDPIVISVAIDSIVPPDSTKLIYESVFRVKKSDLALFYTRLVYSYEDIVSSSERSYKFWKGYKPSEAQKYKNDLDANKKTLDDYRARLNDIKEGKHPKLDSIAQLVAIPKEWQQVTARFKNSESSPLMVKKIIFAVGQDTTIIEKLF